MALPPGRGPGGIVRAPRLRGAFTFFGAEAAETSRRVNEATWTSEQTHSRADERADWYAAWPSLMMGHGLSRVALEGDAGVAAAF